MDNTESIYDLVHILISVKQTKQGNTNMDTNFAQERAEVAIRSRQFIVGSVSTEGQFSISSTPVFHATSVEAEKESRRLATSNPGKTFIVLHLTRGFRTGGLITM